MHVWWISERKCKASTFSIFSEVRTIQLREIKENSFYLGISNQVGLALVFYVNEMMRTDQMIVLPRKKVTKWISTAVCCGLSPFFLWTKQHRSPAMLCHFKVKHLLRGFFFLSSAFTLEFTFISYLSTALFHYRVQCCNLIYSKCSKQRKTFGHVLNSGMWLQDAQGRDGKIRVTIQTESDQVLKVCAQYWGSREKRLKRKQSFWEMQTQGRYYPAVSTLLFRRGNPQHLHIT